MNKTFETNESVPKGSSIIYVTDIEREDITNVICKNKEIINGNTVKLGYNEQLGTVHFCSL